MQVTRLDVGARAYPETLAPVTDCRRCSASCRVHHNTCLQLLFLRSWKDMEYKIVEINVNYMVKA